MLKWKWLAELLACIIIEQSYRTARGTIRRIRVKIGPFAIMACGSAVCLVIKVIQ